MKIIVNNLATEYRDEGDGPVILMLHGWGVDLTEFDKLTEILKEKYRIIRVDLPGFGQSEVPKKWNLNHYLNFVENFIEKLDIKNFYILGHSFGGRIILKGSKKLNPEKIILISPAGVSLKNQRRSIFKVLAMIGGLLAFIPPFIFWRDRIRKKVYRLLKSDYLDQDDKNMRDIFNSVVSEDLSEFASKINLPVLLIWGEHDAVTPLSDGVHLHHLIKDSKINVIKNAGHFSFHDKPEEVVALIQNFL